MCLGPAQPGEREPVADLDALDGLDPHERRGEPRVEPVALLRVRAEARRDALATTSTTPPSVSRSARAASVASASSRPRVAPPISSDAACDRDPDLREERLRHRTRRDVGRGLARARALERVADVLVPELERSREVGVAGPRERDRRGALPGGSPSGGHGLIPHAQFSWSRFADDERERRSERGAVAEPGEHLDLVLLELLAGLRPYPWRRRREVVGDRLAVEPKPGGQAGEDRDERRPVRLAGGGELERHAASLVRRA